MPPGVSWVRWSGCYRVPRGSHVCACPVAHPGPGGWGVAAHPAMGCWSPSPRHLPSSPPHPTTMSSWENASAACSSTLFLSQGPDGYVGEAGSPGERGDQGAKVDGLAKVGGWWQARARGWVTPGGLLPSCSFRPEGDGPAETPSRQDRGPCRAHTPGHAPRTWEGFCLAPGVQMT